MTDFRLPYYQAFAIETLLQANVAAKHDAIDAEIDDGIVLRDVAAGNYYQGPVGQDLALSDTLPAYVLRFLQQPHPASLVTENIAENQWNLQIVEAENDDQSTGRYPQEVLEQRLERMAVAVLQVFDDFPLLSVGGVDYTTGIVIDRVVPTAQAFDQSMWVRGISVFFKTEFGY